MTDQDLATRAPESDAHEYPAPAESSDEADPVVSEHCTTDRPTPSGEAPKGEIRKLGGIDVYLTKPDSYPSNPSKLLLLLTGGTGLKSTNNQIQADRFANEGYVVAMPDLFDNDPAPNSAALPESETLATSFLETFKLKAAETAKSFLIDMWMARHTEEKILPHIRKRGRYVLLLASERTASQTSWTGAQKQPDEEAGEGQGPPRKGSLIKAGALAHAALVSPEDFRGLKSPVSLVCVESDPMFPDEIRISGEEAMSKSNLEHEVQVYPGVPHGFAVVGDYADTNIKEAQATAYEQMLKWLNEH
ncbi:hypothetical protein CIB48_g2131 [Xylaria polymorpha]|nr:hypothetical protein CIB48_g2131 [Xylaria polymorpha]